MRLSKWGWNAPIQNPIKTIDGRLVSMPDATRPVVDLTPANDALKRQRQRAQEAMAATTAWVRGLTRR